MPVHACVLPLEHKDDPAVALDVSDGTTVEGEGLLQIRIHPEEANSLSKGPIMNAFCHPEIRISLSNPTVGC